MQFIRAALLCAVILAPAAAWAEDVPPVFVDPNQPACEGENCPPEQPAVHCEGQNCLPPADNPVEECEGQDCELAAPDDGPMEECEGQDCELAPSDG